MTYLYLRLALRQIMISGIHTLRAIFLISAIILLVQMNQKSNKAEESITEFKWKMYKRLRTDSLTTVDKINLVTAETSVFLEKSERLRTATRRLLFLSGIWITFEAAVLVRRRNKGKKLTPQ